VLLDASGSLVPDEMDAVLTVVPVLVRRRKDNVTQLKDRYSKLPNSQIREPELPEQVTGRPE
jgi:hypothetical protein